VHGVILLVQRYESSPDDISEIGMLCGQASCIGEYDIALHDGYIKAKNNERKKEN
jgi:hypothetical protein